MDYVTGSQGTTTIVSKTLGRHGRGLKGKDVPATPYHAVELARVEADDDRTALCGEAVRYVFTKQPWGQGLASAGDRCRKCAELAGVG